MQFDIAIGCNLFKILVIALYFFKVAVIVKEKSKLTNCEEVLCRT